MRYISTVDGFVAGSALAGFAATKTIDGFAGGALVGFAVIGVVAVLVVKFVRGYKPPQNDEYGSRKP